jgi:hypothetical protein
MLSDQRFKVGQRGRLGRADAEAVAVFDQDDSPTFQAGEEFVAGHTVNSRYPSLGASIGAGSKVATVSAEDGQHGVGWLSSAKPLPFWLFCSTVARRWPSGADVATFGSSVAVFDSALWLVPVVALSSGSVQNHPGWLP